MIKCIVSICRLTLVSANFQYFLRFDLGDENSIPNPRVMAVLQSAENHLIYSLYLQRDYCIMYEVPNLAETDCDAKYQYVSNFM